MGNLYSINTGKKDLPEEFRNLRSIGKDIVTALRQAGYSHRETSFEFDVNEDEGIVTLNYRDRPVAEIIAQRNDNNISLNELWIIGWNKRHVDAWIKADNNTNHIIDEAHKREFKGVYTFIENQLKSKLEFIERPYIGTTVYRNNFKGSQATTRS